MRSLNVIKSDTHRIYGRFSIALLVKALITRRTFRAVFTMRLCQFIVKTHPSFRFTLILFKILHKLTSNSAAIDFPWKTQIGRGLAITHGWGMVVNEGAKIGNNVTLFHGVTLGRRDRINDQGERLTEFPIIEDEVWIGPHAIIVGGITIGCGSRIAGGAFVTESIPPYSVVSGNPARIVKRNCVPDCMNPAPIYQNEC